MTTLRNYFDCVEYFRNKVEKQGIRFDFIDNPYTGNHFVVINGHRAMVRRCGATTPVKEMYTAIKDACNVAWENYKKS